MPEKSVFRNTFKNADHILRKKAQAEGEAAKQQFEKGLYRV